MGPQWHYVQVTWSQLQSDDRFTDENAIFIDEKVHDITFFGDGITLC